MSFEIPLMSLQAVLKLDSLGILLDVSVGIRSQAA